MIFKGWLSQAWQSELAGSLAFFGVLTGGLGDRAFAQITPDSTLGEDRSRVTSPILNVPFDQIGGGATRGNNLFHSFQEFNVDVGGIAAFESPVGIENILSRVTGANPSNILGTLSVAGSNANLFLLNPNGIVFGPDASLDVGGSFVATTANAIQFEDQGFFKASGPNFPSGLTVNPSALLFNQMTTQSIINQSIVPNPIDQSVVDGLRVPDGQSLLLVGGNVKLAGGQLQAQGGRVQIGGVAGAGVVGLDSNLRLNFPPRVQKADVFLDNGANVIASGEGGGEIQIQGRRITLTDNSQIFADTLGNQNGRGISIQASELIVQNGAQVSTSTLGTGQGGRLEVTASEAIRISGTSADRTSAEGDGNLLPSGLFAETEGAGLAGSLVINTGQLIVQDGANVSTTSRELSTGQGGILTVTASDSVKLSGVAADSERPSGLFAQTLGTGASAGNAGNLTVETGQLIVQDGAQVVAGTGDSSQGRGGTLTVTASDSIELSGTAPNPQNTSGLFARTRGSGNAGNLTVKTGQLLVRDKAQVTVSSIGSGNAGQLEITARSIRLNEGGIRAETTSGEGGDITLQVQDLLLLRNASQISTTAGTANAGGNGGNIIIRKDDNTPTQFIIAFPSENNDITANTFDGRGGTIDIRAEGIFEFVQRDGKELKALLEPDDPLTPARLPSSDITAISQTNPFLSGQVTINTDLEMLQGSLTQLSANFVTPEQVVAGSCLARRNAEQGSFTVTGTGGLPRSPYEAISGQYSVTDVQPIQGSGPASNQPAVVKTAFWKPGDPIQEAQGMVVTADGRTIVGTAPQLATVAKAQDLVC